MATAGYTTACGIKWDRHKQEAGELNQSKTATAQYSAWRPDMPLGENRCALAIHKCLGNQSWDCLSDSSALIVETSHPHQEGTQHSMYGRVMMVFSSG